MSASYAEERSKKRALFPRGTTFTFIIRTTYDHIGGVRQFRLHIVGDVGRSITGPVRLGSLRPSAGAVSGGGIFVRMDGRSGPFTGKNFVGRCLEQYSVCPRPAYTECLACCPRPARVGKLAPSPECRVGTPPRHLGLLPPRVTPGPDVSNCRLCSPHELCVFAICSCPHA